VVRSYKILLKMTSGRQPIPTRRRRHTVHGFRSAFRDWAAEHGVDDSVAEQCLAHKIGTAVTRAYLRTTVLERRRKVMAEWPAFLAPARALPRRWSRSRASGDDDEPHDEA
jgi:integrase